MDGTSFAFWVCHFEASVLGFLALCPIRIGEVCIED